MSFPPQPAKRRQIVGTHFVLTNYGDKDRKRTHFSFFPLNHHTHPHSMKFSKVILPLVWQFYGKVCCFQDLHSKRNQRLHKFDEELFFINCRIPCHYRDPHQIHVDRVNRLVS